MRVTNGMMQNNSMSALYKNMGRLDKLFYQMNTLKKIQRPSDDPIIAGRSLKLRLNVMASEQHASNVDEASSWMSVTEAALSNTVEMIKTIREKCTYAANGTLTTDDRQKIVDEITQIHEQLKQEANVTYAGRYVFSGYKTNEPVFNTDGTLNQEVLDNVEGQHISYEIGVNNTIEVNITGMPKMMEQMMGDIDEIIQQLEDPTKTDAELTELFTGMIGQMEDRLADTSKMQSELGSKQSRLVYTKERLSDDRTNFTELLSQTENVDVEEVYVAFNSQYMVYQSALQATSKIVMNSLADFLR